MQPTHSCALRDLIGGIVWDNHACMPLRRGDTHYLDQLAQVHETGVDVITINIGFGEQTAADHLHMLATFRRWIADHEDRFALAGTAQAIDRARVDGKLAICFDIEGMNALDGNADLVSLYYELGVRWMLPAYNIASPAGAGCLDAKDGGLTPFGREVIRAMNDVGMVVCGSHSGYRTAREAIDASATPVIFSHSNPRGMFNHPRNIPDDLMTACAGRGGVIGITGVGMFLGDNDDRTETFADHVDYALDLVGDDHVGIALDYVFDSSELDTVVAENPNLFPPEFGKARMKLIEPARLPEIARTLFERGHSSSTLTKLFGGNHLRIARQVWR
jgi:membrane dipeptidase